MNKNFQIITILHIKSLLIWAYDVYTHQKTWEKSYFIFSSYIFSYFIERGVCYLVLCEQSFSKRLAYSFLEDLQTEFSSNYGSKVETVSRPYSFIEFGKFKAIVW